MNRSATPSTGREVHLASRPSGWPTPENFRIVDTPVGSLAAGHVLVRNQVMSVDPYMRGPMDDTESYVPPYQLDTVLDGAAVGVVIESEDDRTGVGARVQHGAGWREYALLDGSQVSVVPGQDVPLKAYPGVLGMTGLTAYVGLFGHRLVHPARCRLRLRRRRRCGIVDGSDG